MGGKSGGSSKTTIAQYRMSIHAGFCHAVDSFKRVYINEKIAWEGSASGVAKAGINLQDLFGGPKKEGGVQGIINFLPGLSNQVLPQFLQDRLTGTPGVPGFRGLASLFFTGAESEMTTHGFMWSSNVAYVRPIWATMERRPRGLAAGTAFVNTTLGTVNPAHIIFECMTNTEWGMASPVAMFDVTDWNVQAQRLFDESMGLAMVWTRQGPIEEFVNEVLEHINANIVQDPQNMKYKLKLVRDDYDLASTKVINKSNATLVEFQRRGWGETTNEIVVTWTNPQTENEETVSVQDLGNIAAQGSVVSGSKNYYGVREGWLADKLAQRDLQTSAAPLATAEVLADRSFWDSVEGDVVRLDWPDQDAYMVPMRITAINFGRKSASEMRLSLVEDVFGLPSVSYVPPPSVWEDPSEFPRAVPPSLFNIISLPFALAFDAEGATEGNEPLPYPQERAGILFSQTGSDTYAADLQYFGSNSAGEPGWFVGGRFAPLGYLLLQTALVPQVRSTFPITRTLHGTTVYQSGQYVIMGTPSAFNETDPFRQAEIMLVETVDEANNLVTMRRGCLDTVPLSHAVNTPVWILNDEVDIVDMSNIYSDASTPQFRLVTVTSQGALDPNLANVDSHTLRPRPFQPLRPAKVYINDQDILVNPSVAVTNSSITFNWSNRNRFYETTQPVAWDAGNIVPEAGQETVVEIYEGAPSTGNPPKVTKVVGEGGTSMVITPEDIAGGAFSGSDLRYVIYSRRDGFDSFSKMAGNIAYTLTGYGTRYGVSYG